MLDEKRKIPALARDVFIRAETADEKARTVEVIWTAGATVRRRRFWEDDIDEQLIVSPSAIRIDRLNAGAPFLNAHAQYDLSNVIGVVVDGSVRIEGGKGYATIRFSDRADVEPIFRDIVAGIIRNVSVGYRVHKFEIEKRDGAVELWRAVDWEPYEISAVPIGSDPGAQIRNADATETNECVIARSDAAAVQPASTITRKKGIDKMAKLKEAPAGNDGGDTETEIRSAAPASPAAHDPAAIEAARAEGAAAERQRGALIAELARTFGLDDAWIRAMTESKKSEQEVRNAALDELKKRTNDGSNGVVTDTARVTRDAADKFAEGAMNSILVRSGVAGMVRQADLIRAKETGIAAPRIDAGEFRGFTMIDLAREYCEQRGIKTRGLSRDEIWKRSIEMSVRSAGAGFGAQGTGDFAVLLENVVNRTLAASYAVTPDTWQRFCRKTSVNDFKDHTRYRPGSFGVLDAKNEYGEFKQKAISDGEKYKIAVKPKGNIIGLTREAIVNDDLGAFSNISVDLGRAAKLTVENDVYTALSSNGGMGPTLADGFTLYHANHANITGAGVISVALFDAARVLMAVQKDVSKNDILDLRPQVLLVPAGSEGNAKVINGSQYDPDTANKLQRANMVAGLFADIVGTGRLSGSRFYIFADPQTAPAIEVAFLDGQDTPQVQNDDGWRFDGVEMKVVLDSGVAGVDYRGTVTGAGQ